MTHMLQDLDKHAAEFNFPVLDNANVQIADTRLTVFRNGDTWAIFFDFVGFSVPETQFVDDIYAYGSCIYPEGIVGERIPLLGSAKRPLWNSITNECLADWASWTIVIGGEELSFNPTLDEYADAGIAITNPPGPGSIREIDILRFLVHRLGHNFFAPDDELLRFAAGCEHLSKFMVIEEWQHPDIAGDERPSQSVSIRSLLQAIAEGDPHLFDPGQANTHWKNWSGFERV